MPDYFIYSRKSSEAEDRQVLSIDSQNSELTRLAKARGLRVREILTEARSAKEPGRPVFDALMQRINRGEAQGIICWKLDRLARNPIDGGAIIWAMKQHGIEVVTPSQIFRQADDTTMLTYIEFGMAQKFVDDLSKNVKRGLRTKAEKGWRSSIAPLGYLNNKHKEKGERDVSPDPERYHLVRRMWDLMLSGQYTVPHIVRIANEDWRFRTRQMKKKGAKPLWASTLYKVFTDTFYYGWFEYPGGSGRWFRGSHPAMVTEEEYDRVQVLLGRKGKPRPVRHEFAFTGLIRCGECDRMVTAEEKHQLICSVCRSKFAHRSREQCPLCQTRIGDMKNPTVLRYEYYHCIKLPEPRCTQGVTTAKDLESQIVAYLARLEVSERVLSWVECCLDEFRRDRKERQEEVYASQRRAYDACLARLQNLLDLKTSPRNIDGSLLSDDEYERQRMRLLKEKVRLEAARVADPNSDKPFQAVKDTFAMAVHGKRKFEAGDAATKRRILAAFGSNLTLRDKKLSINAKIPFRIVSDSLADLGGPPRPIEPESDTVKPMQVERKSLSIPFLSGRRTDVRTWQRKVRSMVCKLFRYFLEHPDEPVPTFDEPPERFPWQEAA